MRLLTVCACCVRACAAAARVCKRACCSSACRPCARGACMRAPPPPPPPAPPHRHGVVRLLVKPVRCGPLHLHQAAAHGLELELVVTKHAGQEPCERQRDSGIQPADEQDGVPAEARACTRDAGVQGGAR